MHFDANKFSWHFSKFTITTVIVTMSANMSEEEKGEKLKEQEKHLLTATKQRSHYTSQVQQAKAALDGQRFDTADKSSPPATAHYSFDFAQQIHFPHKPLQPGPIYFLTPRKCLIFGVCAEAIPQQVSPLNLW